MADGTVGGPLPRSLRALVRRAAIAPAYAMDVVARAVRAAMGELADDEVLTRSVARRPTPELLCALVIAHTVSSTVDSLRLTAPGTTAESVARAVDEHGLHAPAALLGRGGWRALWSRAHR